MTIPLSRSLLLACTLLSTIDARAQATCDWHVGADPGRPGVNGEVKVTTHWDPDGPGPQPELLVAAGNFFAAGQSGATYLATFDGAHWQPLGSLALGAIPANIEALATFGGDLIVAGTFTQVDGVAASNIVRWDGAAWHALGSGVPGGVKSLAIYNGELIVGSSLPYLNRWNGTTWTTAGPLGTQSVLVGCMATYGGELVIGGIFDQAGGVPCKNVARWNGTTWQPLGPGLAGLRGLGGSVGSLLEWNGNLVVTGSFLSPLGGPELDIARWDGTSWNAMGSLPNAGRLGVHGTQPVVCSRDATGQPVVVEWSGTTWAPLGSTFTRLTSPATLRGTDTFAGELAVFGDFQYASGVAAYGVAALGPNGWHALGDGMDGGFGAFAEHGGDLVAGGSVTSIAGQPIGRVARWDGTAWHALGSGVDNFVLALCPHLGDVIAGGSFTHAGGAPADHVARWDGTNWTPLGSGLAGNVLALASIGGDVYAGGDFVSAGGATVNHIARWDGSSWLPLGSGVDGSVFAIADYHGDLYCGGAFTNAGGQFAQRIARWDGSSWLGLASGMTNDVLALTVFGDELVAAGWFQSAGGSTANRRITRWNGTSWLPLGGGMDLYVAGLCGYDGALFAIGAFQTAGGVAAPYLARWSGTAWSPVPSASQGSSMRAYAGDLIVAATTRFGATTRTAALAHWRCNPVRFGTGCGNPVYTQAVSGPPRLLQPISYTATNGHPSGFALLALGLSDRSYLGVALPAALDSLGGVGCRAWCDLVLQFTTLADATGQASIGLTVPLDPGLVGTTYFSQFHSADGVTLRSTDAFRNTILP